MNEATIRDFFEGITAATELDRAWAGAFVEEPSSDGTVVRRLRTVQLPQSYVVTPDHIAALVDAAKAATLSLRALDAICFSLEASDQFEWDTDTAEGERVAHALFWLGSPEVNYPLSTTVLEKIRRYVLTGQDTFTSDDLRGARGPKRITNVWEPKRGA